MSINGKRHKFEREDSIALAKVAGIKKVQANKMVGRVIEAVRRWPDFAEKAGVVNSHMAKIKVRQRTNL